MSIFVKTFGGTKIVREGDVINNKDWPSQKAFSLFRYLVFRRNEEVPVEELYSLFWEGMEEKFAKSNLNTTLHLIRKTVGITNEHLFVRGNICCFVPGDDIVVDADIFEECHRKLMGKISADEREKLLKKMFEIYAGPFLVEDALEEWVQETREIYESWYSDVLKELFELYLSRKDYESAFEMVTSYVQREPYDESMYYKAVEILLKKGDITRAKRMYDKLSNHLEEIGTKPRLKFSDLISNKGSDFLMNGNKAVVIDEKLFEKILFLESRKRKKTFVLLEVVFKRKDVDPETIAQKIAPLFRRGDVITFSNESIRILVHCPEQQRPTVESRVKNVLGEMGIEKDHYTVL
ncbi:BTAD domain-containing putative transcriptional regulator [Thermotoga sp. SG1]|uniref:AfsR/SARP family transcriptional regulator n=1 Tax=Thermotoga sp. SG1 TaxID=126739 RepID=UPI000C778DC1|nr:BTAD domain-containing putative transcriptional regulator [Thermotoga sp. SG1]PLV56156.1 SARP family transcriptional regulator [Thermotoga sp. SG1]